MTSGTDPLAALVYESYRKLLLSGTEDRVGSALRYIETGYPRRELFEECLRFVHQDLADAPRSDWGALTRVWLFPWHEAECELHEALAHALLAHYKAVFDNTRRALELAMVGVYFLQDHVPETEGREWISAARETPMFSRAVESLREAPRFASASRRAGWDSAVKAFYWHLSDIVHVRGNKGSFRTLQPTHCVVDGVALREFSSETLSTVLDVWTTCVRHIATALALENPILMVGLDLFPKFGYNPPLSGFFDPVQAARLRRVVIPEVLSELERVADEDAEVRSLVDWVDSLPDLTEKELEQQLDDWRKSSGFWDANGREQG